MKRFFVDDYGLSMLSILLILFGVIGGAIGLIIAVSNNIRISDPTHISHGLYRIRDADAGVTCWGTSSGLNCMRGP